MEVERANVKPEIAKCKLPVVVFQRSDGVILRVMESPTAGAVVDQVKALRGTR